MSVLESLDPRVTRLEIAGEPSVHPLEKMENFETYEVFHQAKRGDQHIHVGSVHAPSAELAFVFAKEQYGRRSKSVNLWIVRTADIFTNAYEDADMFETAPEKMYREAGGYKVMTKINKFKKEQKNATQS